jgi:tetratricopeptide (TPR) repeat protein
MIYKIILVTLICCIFFTCSVHAGSYSCQGDECSDTKQDAIQQFDAGESYYNSGDYTKALNAYMTSSKLDYNKCYCDKKIVQIYVYLNQPSRALTESYSAFNSCGDKDKVLWKLQGDAFLVLQRTQEARDAYNKALAIDPNYSEAVVQKNRLPTTISTTRTVTPSQVIPVQTTVPKIYSTASNFNSGLTNFTESMNIPLVFSLGCGLGIVIILNTIVFKKNK